jgi:ABC-type Fe3+/spermidine/putrescine transport system ATPase subunit
MSDRVVVMNAGKIEQVGCAEEIYEHPQTEFVAGFIGVSNIIEGTVAKVEDNLSIVEIGDSKMRVEITGINIGERVRVLIRPEKILLSADGANDSLVGTIGSAIYLGESTQWRVRLGNGQEIAVLEQNRETSRSIQTRIGQRVFINWDPSGAVVLPR